MVNRSPHSSHLTNFQAREYEAGINDLLVHARYLVNSFHVTVRVPPEILSMACSFLTTEEDAFSASQVCRHWRGVLVSSPSLWTRFPCHGVTRTIASLERCKSMPIHLDFHLEPSSAALEKVLLHGNEIVSLIIQHRLDQLPLSDQLFKFSRRSVERLHICPKELCEGGTTRELWQDLPSLRELFTRQYPTPIDQLTAPNLVHLVLEQTGYALNLIVQSVLDMLRGCPLLEFLLITQSYIREDLARHYHPVFLPHLRNIELGEDELCSGLITQLQFPPTVAVGFRMLFWGDISLALRPQCNTC